ncbi:MAG: hypothetical protein ABR528_01270 [Pseudonocardiaceae bacterium]
MPRPPRSGRHTHAAIPHTLFTLLRIGVELDIIGDVTITVDTAE